MTGPLHLRQNIVRLRLGPGWKASLNISLFPKSLGNITRVPGLNGDIFLNESWLVQGLVLRPIYAQFHILAKP